MLDSKIKNKLENIQYEIISQERPILSVSNAEGYYPIEKSAPTFILQTENGFVAVSYTHLTLPTNREV